MTKIFFDIGANNGSTFERMLLKSDEFDGSRVFCFEPSPRCWPELTAVAEKHSARYRITLCAFGIEAKWATPRFYQQTITEGDTFIPDAVAFTGVPAVPLGVHYELRAASVPLVDFLMANTESGDEITLKLDCEGSEYAILDSLLVNHGALIRCRRIMVEWHNVMQIDFRAEEARLRAAFAAAGRPLENWPY